MGRDGGINTTNDNCYEHEYDVEDQQTANQHVRGDRYFQGLFAVSASVSN